MRPSAASVTRASSSFLFPSFFFFQAEDGIRDDLATGVQTCALPICRSAVRRRIVDRARLALAARTDLRADDDSRWSRPYHALSGSRFMAQRILDRDRDRERRGILRIMGHRLYSRAIYGHAVPAGGVSDRARWRP